MDAKLKTLKMPDLRALLVKAGTPAPTKANKQDLISRILASPAAIEAYNGLYPTNTTVETDDLLAPPEAVDWDDTDPLNPSGTAAEPVAVESTPVAATAVTPSETPKPADAAVEDPEEAKKRQRAERFGIPYVAPKPKAEPKKAKSSAKPATDADLKKRAERFGTAVKAVAATATAPLTSNSKRKRAAAPAVVEEVDPEEQERRRKRAERFSTGANA